MKVGDLVKFKPHLKKSDSVMTITKLMHPDIEMVRYWHPKFGDGGWAPKKYFDIVSK